MKWSEVSREAALISALSLTLGACSEPRTTSPQLASVPSVGVQAKPELATSPKKNAVRRVEPPAEGDRDPFARPADVKPPGTNIPCQGKVVLRQHAVSDLQLTGVVGGATTRAAMLRVTATGVSEVVHRGERLGQACARVKAILEDRIVLELQRSVDDQTKSAEHVIALQPKHGGR